jgi:uncharacterized protein YqgV (UPF0045/DUF77 family)
MIAATLAVYPLGQADYTAVDEAIDRLRATSVDVDVGSMHTQIGGDEASVFAALHAAFRAAAARGAVVMTVTVSNACPVPTRGSDRG